jgi:hypothetical protein
MRPGRAALKVVACCSRSSGSGWSSGSSVSGRCGGPSGPPLRHAIALPLAERHEAVVRDAERAADAPGGHELAGLDRVANVIGAAADPVGAVARRQRRIGSPPAALEGAVRRVPAFTARIQRSPMGSDTRSSDHDDAGEQSRAQFQPADLGQRPARDAAQPQPRRRHAL